MYNVGYWKQTKRKNKYNAVRREYNGVWYDSTFEAKYAEELDWRIKAKEIDRWERQVRMSLDVNEKHICNYFIDFKVFYPDGTIEYVEVKGFATAVWQLKWKLFEALINKIEPEAKLLIVK